MPKDKDEETTEEKALRLKGEAEAARDTAARGQALPSDRVVDLLPEQ
jgi:hypothetical protein